FAPLFGHRQIVISQPIPPVFSPCPLICRFIPNPILRRLVGIIWVGRKRLGKIMPGNMAVNKQNRRNEVLSGQSWVVNVRWPTDKMPLIPDAEAASVKSGRRFVREDKTFRRRDPAFSFIGQTLQFISRFLPKTAT